MAPYLTRFYQAEYELTTIDVTVSNGDMVRISSKGFIEEWKPFIKGIIAKEKIPYWVRLWDEFIQEELRDEDLQPK